MNKKITWLDHKSYPFGAKYYTTKDGHQMHYVDEGQGRAIVMVHGNPTWSYLYRHLITGLSGSYRCIAMDHIGFGLSEKPRNWGYLPSQHAANVVGLIEHLGLTNVILVVHDWGGPIGLDFAIEHPARVRKLIIMNTWCWPVKGDHHFERYSSLMGGKFGAFLIRNFNFFVNFLMKKAFGNQNLFTPEIKLHYKKPLARKRSRKGNIEFIRQVIGSTAWLESLYRNIDLIATKPTLLLWGGKDIAFREDELRKWQSIMKNYHVAEFSEAGHYLQEECPDEILIEINKFLNHNHGEE